MFRCDLGTVNNDDICYRRNFDDLRMRPTTILPCERSAIPYANDRPEEAVFLHELLRALRRICNKRYARVRRL